MKSESMEQDPEWKLFSRVKGRKGRDGGWSMCWVWRGGRKGPTGPCASTEKKGSLGKTQVLHGGGGY